MYDTVVVRSSSLPSNCFFEILSTSLFHGLKMAFILFRAIDSASLPRWRVPAGLSREPDACEELKTTSRHHMLDRKVFGQQSSSFNVYSYGSRLW
jgi:hypothetical protein